MSLTEPRSKDLEFVKKLIDRYNTPVPRYTSYPTALEFDSNFDENKFLSALQQMKPDKAISIYIHIPFCEVRCTYCGCNVIVSKRKSMIEPYLSDLFEEIRYTLEKIDFKPKVFQLHFGGGTPNYLKIEDWQKILTFLNENFEFEDGIEQSLEVDPMHLDVEYINKLHEFGFNRISFGVQDVHEKVQDAVNRKQSIEHIEELVVEARRLGFISVNTDFIYGLPYQTEENFEDNLKWIEKYKPNRIALFSYAHIPWVKKHQDEIDEETLPGVESKLAIYLHSRSRLVEMGYVAIGIDHYALPEDELSVALKEKQLHRNFMGYATKANLDMLAFGPSAISQVGDVFAQNHVKLRGYEKSVRERVDLFEKGYAMNVEDKMRAEVVHSIMNNLYVDITEYEKKWNTVFWEKFLPEKEVLNNFQSEGLVEFDDDKIEVTESGGYVVRHIAQTFDEYRKQSQDGKRFSKGI